MGKNVRKGGKGRREGVGDGGMAGGGEGRGESRA